MGQGAIRVACMLCLLVLAGCAGNPRRGADLPPGIVPSTELTRVPFYAQEAHQCGPASLAAVLNTAGFTASPDAVAPLVYTKEREGSTALDMLSGARRAGALAVQLPQSLGAVLAEVAAGRPVIVLQNLSLPIYPIWHYAVVVGYDVDQGHVILRSGRNPRELMSLRTFEHTWARSHHWAMLALAPGQLPVADMKYAYLAATLALERLGNIAGARLAYEAGVVRWPEDLTLLMGAGNTAYAMGDVVAAEAIFRRAVDVHPEASAPLNNLAHVLAQRGAFDTALSFAQRAAASPGPSQSTAQLTLDEINRKVRIQSESPN